MQLIQILLIIIAILTMLSGVAVLFGSSKAEKGQSVWFLLAAICEVFWAVPIAIFLSLPASATDVAPVCIKMLYVSAMIMDTAVLGYVSWRYKLGKVLTCLFLVVGLAMGGLFLANPNILYTDIVLSNAGNRIIINLESWFYYAYIVYFCTLVPTFLIALFYRIRHTKAKNVKNGLIVFLVGTAIAGFLSLVFDLLLPLKRYDLIWIGPMTIGLMILSFYYAILKFRVLHLSTSWLRLLSFVILAMTCAVVYMIIFFIVFTALFRIPNPSSEVLLLNFAMIAVILALMPAVREISMFMRAMVTTKQVDFEYVVKKINKIDKKNFDMKELAVFLADNLHYSFIAIIVNGRVFGPNGVKFSAEDIVKIDKMKTPANGIWQDLGKLDKDLVAKNEISRIACLVGNNGKMFGQVVFGKKLNKIELERRDLIEYETIINLSAMAIENGGGCKS